MAGLSWKQIREGFTNNCIAVAVPTALIKDEWPYDFASGDSVNPLRSPADGNRVHAYLIGSMSAEPSEPRIGGGSDHGTLDSLLTLRFMAILGQSKGTATLSSADEFETELKAVRSETMRKRRNLGIASPDIDELKRVFPLIYEEIYTDEYGDALVHIATGKLQIQLIERW